MAEIIILAERRKARHERRATNVMAMSFELMAAYMFWPLRRFATPLAATPAGGVRGIFALRACRSGSRACRRARHHSRRTSIRRGLPDCGGRVRACFRPAFRPFPPKVEGTAREF